MSAVLLRLWRLALRRWGAFPIAAATMLLLSALALIWTLELHNQASLLRDTIAAKRSQMQATRTPFVRRVPVSEQVDEFVGAFPRLSQNTSDIERVFHSASAHNLQLPRGDYKLKQEVNEPLASYAATFAVHADYAALRDFCADVLRAVPNASLEELRMTRTSADSTELEAIVRFTLIYRR